MLLTWCCSPDAPLHHLLLVVVVVVVVFDIDIDVAGAACQNILLMCDRRRRVWNENFFYEETKKAPV